MTYGTWNFLYRWYAAVNATCGLAVATVRSTLFSLWFRSAAFSMTERHGPYPVSGNGIWSCLVRHLLHSFGFDARALDHLRRSASRIGHSNGTRTTSTDGSTRSSSVRSAPVNRWKVSRSAVSTVTFQPS